MEWSGGLCWGNKAGQARWGAGKSSCPPTPCEQLPLEMGEREALHPSVWVLPRMGLRGKPKRACREVWRGHPSWGESTEQQGGVIPGKVGDGASVPEEGGRVLLSGATRRLSEW